MRNLTAFAIILGLPLYGSWALATIPQSQKVEHLFQQDEIYVPARKPVMPLPNKNVSYRHEISIKAATQMQLAEAISTTNALRTK
jgi:hypothetical protein